MARFQANNTKPRRNVSDQGQSMPEEHVKPMPLIEYRVEENGDIIRTDKEKRDEKVAVYDAEKKRVIFEPGMVKYRAPVLRHLNHAEIPYDDFDDRQRDGGTMLEPKNPRQELPFGLVEPEGLTPARPLINPRLGDKTPEFVEWMRTYKPREFIVNYGVTGRDSSGKFIARRATHLTVVPEMATQDDEYDWSMDARADQRREMSDEDI